MIEEDNFAESYENLALSGQEIVDTEFEDCTFLKCDLSSIIFKRCKFSDCYFKACDLSLMQVVDSQFSAVTFEDCKIIGVDWSKASWDSLTKRPLKFKNSVLNDSSFWGLVLESIMIHACEVKEVDFREANLKEADLSDSDFEKALFRNTNLSLADFSHASNFDIDVKLNDIKEAKFSRYEAIRLLSGLGIELVD